MTKHLRISAESIFNGLLVLFSLFVIFESFRMGFGSLKRPGSGLFVMVCGVSILVLNIKILLRKADPATVSIFKTGEKRQFIVIAPAFFAWLLLIDLLGYVLVTFIATAYLSKALGLSGWRQPLALAFGTALCCYLLFDYVLYLDLPRGFLD